jgi:hypothetical protein
VILITLDSKSSLFIGFDLDHFIDHFRDHFSISRYRSDLTPDDLSVSIFPTNIQCNEKRSLLRSLLGIEVI